jgi:predicted transcriptional regulator
MDQPDIINRTERFKKLKVSELMTETVITIDSDDLVGKASRLMMENHIHSLLVLKLGRPKYIVSTYDLIKLSYEETFNEDSRDLMRTTVEELVKGQELKSVRSDSTLLDALKIFTFYSIHSLPVIDDGRVMGILTLMDLAKWYVKSHEI